MLWGCDKSGKKACTEVLQSEQPSKFFVFTFLTLQFKFSVHSCILCCSIAFPPIHLLISLLPVIFFKLAITRTPDNSNFSRFPLKVRVIGSRLYFMVAHNCHCLLFLPWGCWFCREVFGFAVRFSVLPWGILFLPWGFWFCREVFVFAVRFSVLQWGILFLPWGILFLPWGFWFCRDSCGPP